MSAFRVYPAAPAVSPESSILLLVDRGRARTVAGIATLRPSLRVPALISALIRDGWLVSDGERLSVVRVQSCPLSHRLELLQLRRASVHHNRESNHA